MEYKIFPFKNRYDNHVEHDKAETLTLDEYIQLLSTHNITHDKDSFAFIAGDFKTLNDNPKPVDKKVNGVVIGTIPNTIARGKENLISINSMCIDFDEGVTIEQAKETFKDYLYIGYSSFRHQLKGVDKFRMVFPLEQIVTPDEILVRRKGLREFFKGCDNTTFDIGRIFYLPSFDPANNIKPISWVNYGKYFNPLDDNIQVEIAIEYNTTRPIGIKGGTGRPIPATINLLDLFTSKGLVKNYLGQGKYSVICPNYLSHSNKDTSGTVIWSGVPGARDGFHCQHSHCRDISVRDMFEEEEFNQFCEREDTTIKKLELTSGKSQKTITDEDDDDIVPNKTNKDVLIYENETTSAETRQFNLPASIDERTQKIKDFVRQMQRTKHLSHFILRTPEGYGKSTMIVKELRRSLHKVMFLSSSNKQANEKFETFGKQYSAQRVWSVGALLEELYGVEATYDKTNPELTWGESILDEETTIRDIQCKLKIDEDRAADIFNQVVNQAKNSKVLTADVVISTFSTGNALFNALKGKLGYIIVIDDPNTSDLLTSITHFNSDNNDYLEIKETRDVEEVFFGTEFIDQDKIIWTTTENLVVELIKYQHPQNYYEDVKENLSTNNRLFIFDSKLVRKKFKPILPSIHKVIEERAFENLQFIANGLGVEDNLVNSKGRNDKSESGIIISSCPHPLESSNLAVSLGYELNDYRFIEPYMVTDVIDQAIGRSQGYRGKHSNFTLLICDTKYKLSLKTKSRYEMKNIQVVKARTKRDGLIDGIDSNDIPSWLSLYFQHIASWQSFINIINNTVYNTHTLEKIDADDIQTNAIQEAIISYKKSPLTFIEQLSEQIKLDEPNLLFTHILTQAVLDQESIIKVDTDNNKSNARSKGGSARSGKKLYVHKIHGAKFFVEGTQPKGYKLKSKPVQDDDESDAT